jgi:hypothetical protein
VRVAVTEEKQWNVLAGPLLKSSYLEGVAIRKKIDIANALQGVFSLCSLRDTGKFLDAHDGAVPDKTGTYAKLRCSTNDPTDDAEAVWGHFKVRYCSSTLCTTYTALQGTVLQ